MPAGLTGLLFEHALAHACSQSRSPPPSFLTLNGLILLGGRVGAPVVATPRRGKRVDASRHVTEAGVVGVAQIGALFAGISRSGITMVAGLVRGLDHEDAARFSFLLATPIILAAGIYKLPDLLGPNGDGVRCQALVGADRRRGRRLLRRSGSSMRFFETRTLMPFGIYCLVFGGVLHDPLRVSLRRGRPESEPRTDSSCP